MHWRHLVVNSSSDTEINFKLCQNFARNIFKLENRILLKRYFTTILLEHFLKNLIMASFSTLQVTIFKAKNFKMENYSQKIIYPKIYSDKLSDYIIIKGALLCFILSNY